MERSRTRDEILSRHQEFLFPCVLTYYDQPLPLARGQGNYLWDYDGNRYLDFFGGILTISVGHCNPKVTERVNRQVQTLQHVSTLYPTGPNVDLAARLAEIAPGRLKKSFFTSSGTEADEMAVMCAKIATGRNEIIALRHSYSGRSTLAVTMTAHAPWRVLSDQVPGIKHALSPYCYRCPMGLEPHRCGMACARDLEELIRTTTPGRVAAFIAEPIQGVGGFIVPPREYFQVAVEIVRKFGGLFIADEVQTGFGRTGGKMFGIEHFGVEPDIMTMAKGVANGVPMGITMATPEVADAWVGLTLSTFGGNPVSCEAALATIDTIVEDNLIENAAVQGQRLREHLERLQSKHPVIGDVRGMGLMQAVEFVKDRQTKEPAPEMVRRVFEETRKRHLLIGRGGLYGNVLRLSPPLTISADEIDWFAQILDESLVAASA
ncbi:MAG TPA: aspartate aminotransferase family protein [Candidatus Nitrosotenuis sp.]|jgi:4-aminobutyrate aminotransferase-like enzyme|nr:aspartate aminotransferase family protein [Candidatus Nitrosotenuis sp.]